MSIDLSDEKKEEQDKLIQDIFGLNLEKFFNEIYECLHFQIK